MKSSVFPSLTKVEFRFLFIALGWSAVCFVVYLYLAPLLNVAITKGLLEIIVVLWLIGVGILVGLYDRVRKYLLLEKETTSKLLTSQAQFKQFVDLSPNAVVILKNARLVFINQAGLRLFRAESTEQILGRFILDFIPTENKKNIKSRLLTIAREGRQTPPTNERLLRLDGSLVDVIIASAPLEMDSELAFQLVIQDASEQKKLERAIENIDEGTSSFIGQEFFNSAVLGLAKTIECDMAFIGRYKKDEHEVHTIAVASDGKLDKQFIYSLKGSPCENVISHQACCYPQGVADLFPEDKALRDKGMEGYIGIPLWDSTGKPSGIMVALYRQPIINKEFAQAVLNIFASRVQSEMERNDVLLALRETQARLETIFETIPFDFWVCDTEGRNIMQNSASRLAWGLNTGKKPEQIDIAPETLAIWQENNRRVLSGETIQREAYMTVNGEKRFFQMVLAPVIFENKISGFLGMNIDITDQRRTEQLLRRSYERISALREIDHAILGGVDIAIVLDSLLGHAISMLGIDSAEILYFHSENMELEIAARRNVGAYSIEKRFPVEGDISSRAIVDLKKVVVTDFQAYLKDYPECQDLRNENFQVYIALPLLVKGKVRGVLEFFHLSSFQPDKEWWAIAESFADQVAIAIDNHFLFRDLQISNQAISEAYDLTLEGWSRALEIRDHDTEGHTRRVTGLTLRLAKAAGYLDEELIHIRRGALLHDIGKMGIPDAILHKPGPLTEEEWEVIRRHPQMAFDLLMPIPFLRPALDIPYYHHERWDGKGYPHGLLKEEIPLAARIFTVVDVWDALTTDRPYRPAMPVRQAIEYMRANSGSIFDPAILDLFIHLVETNELEAIPHGTKNA